MAQEVPFDDARRLKVLRDYRVLDTPPAASLDNITSLAARMFRVPIALVSLVDEDRQWFKSRFGLESSETPREVAFCDHAIRDSGPLIVPDATADPRFEPNPLVTGDPSVRFYCGVPLRSPDGHALGTLCGYGLGLAFCRLAVEAHGGRIGVVSNEPVGNRFFVELPPLLRASA